MALLSHVQLFVLVVEEQPDVVAIKTLNLFTVYTNTIKSFYTNTNINNFNDYNTNPFTPKLKNYN